MTKTTVLPQDQSDRAAWRFIYTAAFGNPYKGEPKICIVSTRYGGCYEGGLFAALPVEALDSAAFADDCSASDWWFEHAHMVGVGATPNDALLDWYQKLQARTASLIESGQPTRAHASGDGQ